MTEPLIPFRFSERLFVAFSVVVQELNNRTDYPTDNLDLILHQYEHDRTQYLGGKGWPSATIKAITEEQVVDLHKWISERAEQTGDAKSHLELWERELKNSPDGCGS